MKRPNKKRKDDFNSKKIIIAKIMRLRRAKIAKMKSKQRTKATMKRIKAENKTRRKLMKVVVTRGCTTKSKRSQAVRM